MLTRYRERLWTSLTTVIELLLLCAKFKLDPERIVDASQIAESRGVDVPVVLLAAHFIRTSWARSMLCMRLFAFHEKDDILSSDKVFDRVGLVQIPLEPAKKNRD